VGSVRLLIAASLALVVGCNDGPKPAKGERVSLTTEVVEQICRGTLDHIDAEIERIESELDFAALSERIELHVVAPEAIEGHCGVMRHACVLQPPRRLYIAADVYERLIRLELARDRLARTAVGRSKPLFYEGLAGALTWPSCQPWGGYWSGPTATEVLEADSRTVLGGAGRYLGGELMRWLLDTHGPAKVLAFVHDVGRFDHPDLVRLAYIEHFTRIIDTDLFAHWRPDDQPVDRGRSGCIAPEAPRREPSASLRLAGELDCSATGVRNDFGDPSRAFVEWTLTVSEAGQGQFRLRDSVPAGIEVTIEPCRCIPEPWSHFGFETPDPAWPAGGWRWLLPGIWRLKVHGPIGAAFDLEIQAPCNIVEQDCPTGQQCSRYRECVEEVTNPAGLGEPCEVPLEYEGPRTCAGGLACVGSSGGQGVCMQLCAFGGCPEGMVCNGWGSVCAQSCDPLAQDCPPGHACVFDPEGGSGCLPVGDVGVMQSCRIFDLDCAPGLSCTWDKSVEGCLGFIEGVGPTGCCAPYCDPSMPDAGCPAELPNCGAFEGAAIGVCGS
jgi:hypothetical protein